jgi:hypothetical protein
MIGWRNDLPWISHALFRSVDGTIGKVVDVFYPLIVSALLANAHFKFSNYKWKFNLNGSNYSNIKYQIKTYFFFFE